MFITHNFHSECWLIEPTDSAMETFLIVATRHGISFDDTAGGSDNPRLPMPKRSAIHPTVIVVSARSSP
jgi:hypothetical protein